MPNKKEVQKAIQDDTFDCLHYIGQLLRSGQINDSALLTALKKEIYSIHKIVIAAIHTIQNEGRLIYITPGSSERIHIIDVNGPLRPQHSVAGKKYCSKTGGNELLARIEMNELQISPRDMVICFVPALGFSAYADSSLKYAKKNGAMTVGIRLGKEAEKEISAHLNVCLDLREDSVHFQKAWLQKVVIHLVSNTASNYIINYELKQISF